MNPTAGWRRRLTRAAYFVLFSLILLIPKTLRLRRRPAVWNSVRVAAVVSGAYLVQAGGFSLAGLWGAALAGLALAVRPQRRETSVDEQVRALGALIALNGGRFASGTHHARCRIYVGGDRLCVLDHRHAPLAEFACAAISSVRAEMYPEGWRLVLMSGQQRTEFLYEGVFAEHLARVAETTLRDHLRRSRQTELRVIGA